MHSELMVHYYMFFTKGTLIRDSTENSLEIKGHQFWTYGKKGTQVSSFAGKISDVFYIKIK